MSDCNVLSVNAGSSSLKLALYRVSGAGDERLVGRAAASAIGQAQSTIEVAVGERRHTEVIAIADHAAALAALLAALTAAGAPRPSAVGHRFVHGGTKHVTPERIDDALLEELRTLVPLAPNHLPSELALIEATRRTFGALPQVVCFDTAFHRTMPPEAQHFALPRALYDQGVQRFGFHGLSYEYVVGALAENLRPRTIIAHLGSGASMVALDHGVSVETTMGLTPMGGLMMSTRSGDLDPGVMLYLLRTQKLDADALATLVSQKAGLLGISQRSPDMKQLVEARHDDVNAALAVRMFVHAAQKSIGALAAVLGGVDLLVFTGGIGERSAPLRREICAPLGHLGLSIDAARNEINDPVISAGGENIRVVTTDEDRIIARHTARAC